MLTIQDQFIIAANSTNPNILQNTRLEFSPATGLLDFYFTGSAVGLTVTIKIDGEEVVELSKINTQNRLPVVPDDLFENGIEVDRKQKITAEVNNTTVGVLTVFHKTVLTADPEFDDEV